LRPNWLDERHLRWFNSRLEGGMKPAESVEELRDMYSRLKPLQGELFTFIRFMKGVLRE